MWGFNCPICKEPKKLCDCPMCDQCKEHVSEYSLEDGICDKCLKQNHITKHQCESCGDIYSGELIYVGDNKSGFTCHYCPACTSFEITDELCRYDEAKDLEEKNAHAREALQMIEKLQKEIKEMLK